VNVDPFELLGVDRDAGTGEINAAFRHLACVFDPRRWAGEEPTVQAEAAAWSEALVRAREAALDAVVLRSAAMPGAPNRPGRLLVAVAGPVA
jgi:preprotein translocase subunit Sec63